MQSEPITIFLSPIEAASFVEFQKYHEIFLILEAQGVFQINFGKATLNFAHGVLQNIVKEEVVFKR